MIEAFTFSVIGNPRPKARPRRVKAGHFVSTALPKEKIWKAVVERACREALAERGDPLPLFPGAVRVSMQFTFKATNSNAVGSPHTQKPDKDNLEKLVLDVMERAGVVRNDSQAADGPVSKVWGERGSLMVLVEPLTRSTASQTAETLAGRAPEWLIS